MKVYGMLTVEELQQQVDSREIDTVLVVFTDLYGRFMGKRFDAEFFLEDAVENGTHCCDYLVTVDMEMDPVSGYEYTNWERGYGDFHLVPDLVLCVKSVGSTAAQWCFVMLKRIKRMN